MHMSYNKYIEICTYVEQGVCRGFTNVTRVIFLSAKPKLLSATANFRLFGEALWIRCGIRKI